MALQDDIDAAYRVYSKAFSGTEKPFPLGYTPPADEGSYVRIGADGSIALIDTERGRETARRETMSVDTLMFWIFEEKVSMRALSRAYDRDDLQGDPRRAAHAQALEEIGRMNPDWQARLKEQHLRELSTDPYND